MVKLILLIVLPLSLFSGEFVASVNRNQVSMGESLILNLVLSDTAAKETPSIGTIPGFTVNSKSQATNHVMINGQVSTSTVWKIGLAPQKEGVLTIPPISIKTTEGVLSTDAITIHVVKPSSADPSQGIALKTIVSKENPYKNEPISVVVRVESKQALANVAIQKIDIADALIEPGEKPQVTHAIEDGVRVDSVEFTYLLTPLKAGTLIIPPIVVQGGVPAKQSRGMRGSLLDELFNDFDRLKQITLATEEVRLEVKPPIPGINPWLPATAFKIEEIFDPSQKLQAKEPFTRSFKIEAEGLMASQLPSLNDSQIAGSGFKVYRDKPETGNVIKNAQVKSFKKEQYTLIPQQGGTLTLPEITVAWFDVTKNEKAYAKVPARTLIIEGITESPPIEKPPAEQHIVAPVEETATERDPLLYTLIAVLSLLLLCAALFVIALQRKITRMTDMPTPKKETPPPSPAKEKPPAKDKKEKLPDLNPT